MLYKRLKNAKLKIIPTCFRSYVIHHQGVRSCAWLKLLLVVHRYLSCACSVFGSVIFEPVVCVCAQMCACVPKDSRSQPVISYTYPHTHTHTHTPQFKKLRCQTLTKQTTNICETLQLISVKHSSVLLNDGSHTIQNMLDWFLILCLKSRLPAVLDTIRR